MKPKGPVETKRSQDNNKKKTKTKQKRNNDTKTTQNVIICLCASHSNKKKTMKKMSQNGKPKGMKETSSIEQSPRIRNEEKKNNIKTREKLFIFYKQVL